MANTPSAEDARALLAAADHSTAKVESLGATMVGIYYCLIGTTLSAVSIYLFLITDVFLWLAAFLITMAWYVVAILLLSQFAKRAEIPRSRRQNTWLSIYTAIVVVLTAGIGTILRVSVEGASWVGLALAALVLAVTVIFILAELRRVR